MSHAYRPPFKPDELPWERFREGSSTPRVSHRVVSGGRVTGDRHGSVTVEPTQQGPEESCPCGGVRPIGKPHAPIWRMVDGTNRLVDCDGRWWVVDWGEWVLNKEQPTRQTCKLCGWSTLGPRRAHYDDDKTCKANDWTETPGEHTR